MAKQTVLLVDADLKSARVLEVSLRKAGYSVTLVKSATEAVDAIEIATPDLVLSDTRLAPPSNNGSAFSGPPLTDGYQLCRRLKDDPVWCSIPFIFLTSSSSIEDKIRGLELGVEDYLTKPIYIKEILTRIQLVLAKKQREGMEGRTSRASFSGLLSEMGLVDLLSTIDLGRKSGALDVAGLGGKGTIFFRDGAVVDARCGRYTGALAVYRMLVWNDGQFEIRFGPQQCADVIQMSTQGLLMEGMRRLDEWQRLQEQLPPLDAVYDVDTRELAARLGEIPDEVNQILRAFNGERTLLEVVDESGFDDLAALATLSKLYFEGLIFQRPTQPGTGVEHTDEPAPEVVPGSDDADHAKVPGADGRTDDAVLLVSAGRSVIPPPPDARASDVDLSPPRVPGMASAMTQTLPAPPVGNAARELSPQTRTLPDDTVSATVGNGAANNFEERDVAKHRGKRKRAKRQMTEDNALRTSGAAGVAAQAAEAEDDSDDVGEASPVAASTPAPSASAAAAPAPSAPPATASAPAPSANAAASEEPAASPRPEPRERVESSNVIQFPKSPAVAPALSAQAVIAESEHDRPTIPSDRPPADVRASDAPAAPEATTTTTAAAPAISEPATAKSVPAPAAPAETKPSVKPAAAPTPPETAAREAVADKPAVKTSEPPAAKPSDKPADKKSKQPPPVETKAAPEARDRKDSTGGAAARDRKDSSGTIGRDRKDSAGLRDRKISFSTELTDEAKAFFQDKSYEAAYKPHHDTFEDLKPEETPDTHKNRRAMLIASGLIMTCLIVVGGFALHNRLFGVTPPTLPATPASLTPPPANAEPGHTAAVSENHNGGAEAHAGANNNAAPPSGENNNAAPANTPPANVEANAAAAGTTPPANGATEPANANPPPANNAAAAAGTAPANGEANSATAPANTAAAPPSATTAAAPPPAAGTNAAAAGSAPANPAPAANAAATTAAAAGTAPAPGAAAAAPPAAGGSAELLQAALRARSRGNAAAATAFEAYVAAGGNDAGQLANFAFWLANRGDLGRAETWAERASTLDANNQLAWYVLGVARLEGPHHNGTAAREALRRCAALPGRYASECRGAM